MANAVQLKVLQYLFNVASGRSHAASCYCELWLVGANACFSRQPSQAQHKRNHVIKYLVIIIRDHRTGREFSSLDAIRISSKAFAWPNIENIILSLHSVFVLC